MNGGTCYEDSDCVTRFTEGRPVRHVTVSMDSVMEKHADVILAIQVGADTTIPISYAFQIIIPAKHAHLSLRTRYCG